MPAAGAATLFKAWWSMEHPDVEAFLAICVEFRAWAAARGGGGWRGAGGCRQGDSINGPQWRGTGGPRGRWSEGSAQSLR